MARVYRLQGRAVSGQLENISGVDLGRIPGRGAVGFVIDNPDFIGGYRQAVGTTGDPVEAPSPGCRKSERSMLESRQIAYDRGR